MKKDIMLIGAALLLFLCSGSYAAVWEVPGDFPTIQGAVDSALVINGDTILVGPGGHYGAFINKSVVIKGTGGATIDAGPLHPAGLIIGFRLLAGSDGTTITHLRFTVDLAIMNGAEVDNVTVAQCTFLSPVQAVSQWGGSGWEITHNDIIDLRTRNGGGIGILVADWNGEGIVENNVISHNKISGTLFVGGACAVDPSCEQGGYDGSGIVIYADFRWGWPGAEEISNNRVVKNKVSLVSDTPALVDVNAFELTENYYPNDHPGEEFIVIVNNAIGFNDFRGTASQMLISPEELEDYNDISRNLGDNRGHGLHPSLFGPGGN